MKSLSSPTNLTAMGNTINPYGTEEIPPSHSKLLFKHGFLNKYSASLSLDTKKNAFCKSGVIFNIWVGKKRDKLGLSCAMLSTA